MSYGIHLTGRNGAPVVLSRAHHLKGCTFAVGGTQLAYLNVTSNYAEHFYRVLGDDGIRAIYGKTAAESLPVLREAAAKLRGGRASDYWSPTEGNARAALLDLITLAELAPPDSLWGGD